MRVIELFILQFDFLEFENSTIKLLMMASMRAMSINRLHAIPFSDTIATHIIATHIATITRCILVGVGDILDQNGGTSGCEGLLRLKVVVLTVAKHGSERLYQLRRNLNKLIHLQL